MNLVIAGSRSLSQDILEPYLEELEIKPEEVSAVFIAGIGNIDLAGKRWADNSLIPVFQLKVSNKFIKYYGGTTRNKLNQTLTRCGDMIVAVWDGKSTGTADVIQWGRKAGRPVHVKKVG